jgi:hypothetical protein
MPPLIADASHDRRRRSENLRDSSRFGGRQAVRRVTGQVCRPVPQMMLERGFNSIDEPGGFSDAEAYLDCVRNIGNAGDRATRYTGKCCRPMVLQASGNDALCLLHRGAMPRLQERTRWHLLRPACVALVAWQGSLSKTVAPSDWLVGAIRTILDVDISLREVADCREDWFPAAAANRGPATGICSYRMRETDPSKHCKGR